MSGGNNETRLRYERVGEREVKIIVEKGDLRKEVIATVVPTKRSEVQKNSGHATAQQVPVGARG